ncbi:endoglucanase type K [Physcia stellaris]|nr:endoglucanase type K [Physcia stellaris]
MPFSTAKLAIIVSAFATLGASQSGSGKTTRYWDCCKPSCAWEGKGQAAGVVGVCDINDNPLADPNAQSGCQGGNAFACSSQSPWAVNENLAYGFASVSSSSPACCSCFELTFKDTALAGKKMVVQATNTGDDVAEAQFDIAMPGGGFGLFDACTREWNATPDLWGQTYGGIATNTCASFPQKLQAGCGFRWDWFMGADNPTVDYKVVACPAEIVQKSGCGVTGGAKFRY